MHEDPKTEETTGRARSPNAMGLMVVAIGYVVSRLYFFWLGVRFETSSLEWYWQVLDPQLLSERLLESLFYLHSQPPLFNLILGVGLKLSPDHSLVLFHVIFMGLGLLLAVAIYLLLTRFGLSPLIAAVLVLLYATSPNWLMYENWLFYDFPNAVALVLAGGTLVVFGRTDSIRWLVLFFALLTAVVWTRSLFHPVWFAGCVGVVMVARPRRWRAVAAAAAVPLVLIFVLFAKNLVVFAFFGSSSWLGMSLTRMTTAEMDPNERDAWVREELLSPVALVPPFSPVESYESVGIPITDCGIPALGWRLRSTGAPNFNHLAYLEVSRMSLSDALTVIRLHPGVYLRSVARSGVRFFWSPVNYPPFRNNLVATASTYRLFESTVNLPPVAAMLGLLAFAYGGVRGWRWLRGSGPGGDVFFAFSVFTIGWVFCVSSLLEFGENFRFRFAVEPLVFVMLGAVLAQVMSGKKSKGILSS